MWIPLGALLRTRLFCTIVYQAIRLYSASWRLSVEGEQPWLERLHGGGRVLLCTWHQQFAPAIRHFGNYRRFRPALMISRSKDGDIVANMAACNGWLAVRGSSSRGGGDALRRMVSHLRQHGLAGHILDGPRGPSGRVKPGVILLAQAAEAAIVPFFTSADRAWHLRSWDRFCIPKPFARVRIEFCAPLMLPPTKDPTVLETQRLQLERLMLPKLRGAAATAPQAHARP
jgi:hypothetical protein